MRVFNCLILIVCLLDVNAQSYVDSGIQKYHLNQFEEAIIDFDKGYELRDALQNSAVAKIFFYRGLSKLELIKDDGENKANDLLLKNAFGDLENSLHYGNEWPSKLEEAKNEIGDLSVEYAETSEKRANRENEFDPKIQLMKDQIGYLSIGHKLSLYNADLRLGQVHKAIGDLYFERTEDLSALQIVKENYEAALKFYEVARYDDPYSKQIIKDVLEISHRLNDQSRVEEYQKLLELAGG